MIVSESPAAMFSPHFLSTARLVSSAPWLTRIAFRHSKRHTKIALPSPVDQLERQHSGGREMTINVHLSGLRTALATLAVATVLASGSAYAQQDAAGGVRTTAWIKQCGEDPAQNKNVCTTRSTLVTNQGQFLANAVVFEVQGEARKRLAIAVPPGMQIQPGLAVQIDDGQQREAKYTICFPNACFAELVVDDGIINQMKAGAQLRITTLNQGGQPVGFPISLVGFTASYDGEPLDPDQIAEQQRQEQEQFESWADQVRRQMIESQRAAQSEANSEGEATE